jgi:hypothetical protein
LLLAVWSKLGRFEETGGIGSSHNLTTKVLEV